MRIQRIRNNIICPDLSYKICGLCFKVHNQLGRYRNEKQYADALENILKENKIDYTREKPLNTSFEGEKERRNIPDFVIENKLIIDLKSKDFITKDDYFQMQRYLKSANIKLGIIINFRQKTIYPKRIINKEI